MESDMTRRDLLKTVAKTAASMGAGLSLVRRFLARTIA